MRQKLEAINNRFLYGHRMKILRLGKMKQADGSTKTEWMAQEDNIPCKLSQDNLDAGGGIQEDVNPIEEKFTVFCDVDIPVQAGDLLEIDGIRYRAGNPFHYPAHQEIKIARETLA